MSIPDPITLRPSEPVEFREAVDYFRKQAPWISGSSWSTMADLSAKKGEQVSGATMLRMVDDVWSRMDRAMKEGLPYSEFVRGIGKDFKRDWVGVDSSRLKLIYHNNVGSALMAGRMRQMTDPDVISDRPFLLFDAIEDFRTSDICRERDGIKKRADDPWWKLNTPLLHHNCRSSVISLDEEDLAEEGGLSVQQTFENPPGQGWGSSHSWEDWKPKGTDYHPALWTEYQNWLDGKKYAHDLKTWRKNLVSHTGIAITEDISKHRVPENVMPKPEVKTQDERLVRRALDQWVVGSKRKTSVILKQACLTEFGLSGVAYSRVQWKITDEDVLEMRSAARVIYQDTQAYLAKMFPGGTIRVYRGVKSTYAISGVLESWTTDIETARKFNGYDILMEDVPIAQVFALSGGPNWKNGKYGEQFEVILLSDVPRKD